MRLHPLLLLLITLPTCGKTLHVSPSGAGAKDGSSASSAFAGPAAAISAASAGDTILLQGGTYALGTRLDIAKSGTAAKSIHLLSENPASKRAVLDFASQGFGSSNQGIKLTGSYWHIKGIDVLHAGDNGMLVYGGAYDTIEWCSFHDNQDAGFQIRAGAHHALILNCDSYNNFDSLSKEPGGNADGFAPKLDVGDSVVFQGCRSYDNSDDGWDGYLKTAGTSFPDGMTTILVDCWTFNNGYYHGLPSSKLSTANDGNMNGNGFKMGGSDAKDEAHGFVLRRCLSFLNKKKQFDQNNNTGSMTLINCTAYGDGGGDNYALGQNILKSGARITVENSVNLGGGAATILSGATQATNSWSSGLSASSSDFQSLDTTGVRGPRKSDGSLPDIAFMHLKTGSKLVDAGTKVAGISYGGSAPDLGAFETGTTTTLSGLRPATDLRIDRVGGGLRIDGTAGSRVRVAILSLDGRRIRDLGEHELAASSIEIPLGALPPGISICRASFSDGSLREIPLSRL